MNNATFKTGSPREINGILMLEVQLILTYNIIRRTKM
jgi:hypothetical protein